MFFLVRHGKTDYSEKNTKIYQGFGVNLAPLSEKGMRQAKKAAKDPRLKDAEMILSSPYTRALQTAAIISRKTGTKIVVETELHEWLANKDYIVLPEDLAEQNYEEYRALGGEYPPGKTKDWEDRTTLKNRLDGVLTKYADLKKVIVVCHGTMIEAASGCHLKTGGIIEYTGFRTYPSRHPASTIPATAEMYTEYD